MKVAELIAQLQNFDPDLDVECITIEADWSYSEIAGCSEEVDRGVWGAVGGVELHQSGTYADPKIRIFVDRDDISQIG